MVIALPDLTYAVILADRGDHIMLWTAHVVEKPIVASRFGRSRSEAAKETPSKADVARKRTTFLLFLRVVDEPSRVPAMGIGRSSDCGKRQRVEGDPARNEGPRGPLLSHETPSISRGVALTGKVLVAPRSRRGQISQREEVRRTGVYLLVEDPTRTTRPRALAYIGEGDNVLRTAAPRELERGQGLLGAHRRLPPALRPMRNLPSVA